MMDSTVRQTANAMPVYESHPPAWLPQAHGSADLGYPGFYPPRPGQEEDVMSQANIKRGLILGEPVPAETFSAHDMIKSRFAHHDALTELEDLMNEIFSRRAEHTPSIPRSSFRMPSRVTLNDSKREAWFADLANPDVPLHKLGKNVPHGAKGHDLLDLLQQNDVAIPRAVWFLRVFGANETAGLRNKPSYNPTQYSIEWANVVTGYMKKQLADIALPSAPRPGLNIKQTFKSVLGDTETRDRWILRFTYCLRLLRTFYSQGLVDNRTFLTWLVQTMSICNLAQAGFVARLAEEYLDGIMCARALTKPFIDACLEKLVEIRTTSAQEYLPQLETRLKVLLGRISISLPDAFVSVRTWMKHSILLTEVLTTDIVDQDHAIGDNGGPMQQGSNDIQQNILDNFTDIKQRNEAMLFKNMPPLALAKLGSTVIDIQLLNSISSTTDMESVIFFESVADDPSIFAEKIDILLSWAVTPLQFGDHRPYAAATLIGLWRNKCEERAMRREFTSPNQFLQDQLFDWLDESDIAGEDGNLRNVAGLFGKLVKDNLFDYAKYVQRLVARGEPGLSYTEGTESRHRKFLRCIPLHHTTSSLVGQRKVTLHGARAREIPEDLNEREMRKEIRAVLPPLFGGEARPNYLSATALLQDCTILFSASRYEQVRTFRRWLLPILCEAIDGLGQSNMNHSNLLQTYCMSVEIMSRIRCYGSILELSLFMLERAQTTELLTAVIETLHRYVIIWACMHSVAAITMALYNAHQVARTRGIQSRALLTLLLEIDNGHHLDPSSREHVSADIAAFTHALHPDTETPNHVPPVLPEILLLAEDPNPEAPSILANSLWYKYRTAFDWAWKVWDNTVASLRQVPVMRPDVAGRQACALRYGRFLIDVDQHLPGGIDDQVLQWFLGTGKSEVSALNADAWDVLNYVLLYLSVHGALAATTILRGLIYPAWQLGANATSEQQGQSLAVFLGAANRLFDKLLLREEGGIDGIPPMDLLEIQRIRTRRQHVYRESHFAMLVTSILTLVFIEKNENISEDLRNASSLLRISICGTNEFRQGSHRNLDTVRNAFEQPFVPEAINKDLSEHVTDALRLILNDAPPDCPNVGVGDWQNISSLLSPWRLAATAIQLQFTLRQLGRMLAQESTSQCAKDCLDKLTANIFHHSMTSEEAYFVAEMARGVDGAVAGKFVNNGLRCISEILRNTSASLAPADFTDQVERTGQLLRVLTHVIESMREEATLLPQLEPAVQDELIAVLCSKFDTLESSLTTRDSEPGIRAVMPQVFQSVIFLARLLQFDLGFHSAWTPKTKETSIKLVSTLFRLALIYGTGGSQLDLVAYPLLLDTLYYIIDEIPKDIRTGMIDPFRHYPPLSISDLPADIPPEYRRQLRWLLPDFPPIAAVSNLVTAHRDPSGQLVLGAPVLNRPWEWVENLGDHNTTETKDDDEERGRNPIKNNASLSLDLFNARVTGDGIVVLDQDDSRNEGNIRSFEDSLTAESVFKRDWRETRIELDNKDVLVGGGVNRAEEADELGGLPSFPRTTERLSASRSLRASPVSASSIRSHQSTILSVAGSSTRSSPHQPPLQPPPLPRSSISSASDPIDVDAPVTTSSTSTRRTSKRKIATSDDEIEIIDGPNPASSQVGKKSKGKTTAKARVKRR